jgi:hypothetical protein
MSSFFCQVYNLVLPLQEPSFFPEGCTHADNRLVNNCTVNYVQDRGFELELNEERDKNVQIYYEVYDKGETPVIDPQTSHWVDSSGTSIVIDRQGWVCVAAVTYQEQGVQPQRRPKSKM